MIGNKLKILNYITSLVPGYVSSAYLSGGLPTVHVKKEFLTQFITVLQLHEPLRFESLLDIWALDRLDYPKRFKIGYNLLSPRYNLRLVLFLSSYKEEPIPSLVNFFHSSVWLEREVWDMFGIFFSNHSDLRRILTDYGFSGFPLRKDFPLSGYTQARYDEENKKVVLESLDLEQEFRFFNFSSPWARLR